MWVGLLFAIMCISALISMPHANEDIDMPADIEGALTVKAYREKAVQCMVLGRYTHGGPYVIQTLIIYIAIEHLLQGDTNFATHILLGMILNIAMRMGYHRDPKNFKVISPFEGEMRRRTWGALIQANLIFASQMGLPSMLKDHHTDTEEPRNLYDFEFDEDTTELPPSRPETEVTPVIYIIARNRVARLWEKVRDIATDTRHHKYEEILMMDQALLVQQRQLPPPLKMQPMAQSIADPPQLIMQRIWIDISFWRLQIVLHKKYFMAPGQYERYSYSRKTSLKAALKITEYQHIVYENVRTDGLLYDARWKLSSVMNNEFLLANSILCAYLKQVAENPQSVVEDSDIEEIHQMLTKSLDCWKRFSASSKYARKAIEVIRIVLKLKDTPTETPDSIDELSPMLAFQDPLLLDLNFPCTLNTVFDDDPTINDPSLDPTTFGRLPMDDEWINMFQRVSTRVSGSIEPSGLRDVNDYPGK
ncbi:hypothetical protein M426DRAFT_102385 [Hypoxylon sp. CI-4A]|nr:hypothetical protein M426DRAFT_102385 [Hypoxylon sp. CI-4A]